MQAFGALKLLAVLSARNLFSHKVKSIIVGSIMLFGTFLVVLGTALLDSVESSMSKSITSSLAGQLQVYDAKARDRLALFGGMSMGAEDIGKIRDFAEVKSALGAIDNVAAVVPMGIDFASMSTVSEMDRTLADLRRAVYEKNAAEIDTACGQVRQLAKLVEEQLKNELAVSSDRARIEHALADLARVRADEFWAGDFARDPLAALEFLDTQIAPLSSDAKLTYLRYLGTDPSLFAQEFDRFEIVDGEMIPEGHRGFLFNKKFYEDQIKHRVARELDFIRASVIDRRKRIEEDGALKARVSQLPRQYQRITFQLDAAEWARLEAELRKLFPDAGAMGLEDLVKRFLTVDEENIAARTKFFYDVIAPMVQLYDYKVGDTITIRGFTKSGYVKAVNVKVYGTFQFRGLERSDIAGGHNIVDMLTFRDLYGYMTEERKKEVDAIRGAVGVKDVGRANAEAELFGGDTEIVDQREAGRGFDEFRGVDLAKSVEREGGTTTSTFGQAAIDRGVALNAAIVLKDPRKIVETAAKIRDVSEEKGLGLQVVDWQTASGIVGQFIVLIRFVLYAAISIIFTVALVIINNSMVTATMERVTEIGTMRAIGAQRSMVMLMFMLETAILGLGAGGLGALLGAGVVTVLGAVGLPAKADILVFLFAGPSLHPTFGPQHLLIGLVSIVVVSIASTLYPARIATRIQPVVAMQKKE